MKNHHEDLKKIITEGHYTADELHKLLRAAQEMKKHARH